MRVARGRKVYEIVAVAGICLATAGLAVLILLHRAPQRFQFGKFSSSNSVEDMDFKGVEIDCPIVLVVAHHDADWELIIDSNSGTDIDYAWEKVHIVSNGACDVLTRGSNSTEVERRSHQIDDDDLERIKSFTDSWSKHGVHQRIDRWASCGAETGLSIRVRIGDELWAFDTDSIVNDDLAYFLNWLDDEVVEPARRVDPLIESVHEMARMSSFHGWNIAPLIPCKDVTNEVVRDLLAKDTEHIAYLYLDYTAVTDLSFLTDPRFEYLRTIDLSHSEIVDLSTLPQEVCERLERLRIDGTEITSESLRRDWDKLRLIPQIVADVELPSGQVMLGRRLP